MTTPAAHRLYVAQHQFENEMSGNFVYNPHERNVGELPVIYGLNNGGTPGLIEAVALSEDGEPLSGWICSDEGYMPYDLGMITSGRGEQHEKYRAKYPDGYRCEFVSSDRIQDHPGIQKAIRLSRERKCGGE